MIGLALCVTLLRVWVRLHLEQRQLTSPDYFVWAAWLFASGWFICSIIALKIGMEHPLDEVGVTDSIEYLKVSRAALVLLDFDNLTEGMCRLSSLRPTSSTLASTCPRCRSLSSTGG
jgi:hypothetical protein